MNASKPRKLILHIGAHKTGSTAIQNFLRRRRSDFLTLGWSFCIRKEKPINWGHMIGFHREADGAQFELNKPAFQTFLAQIDQGHRDIILSAEDLFFLDGSEIALFGTAMANRFSEITLVSYLRRQDQMAMSHWAQGAKTIQSALVFGRPDYPLPHLTASVVQYLDYATKLGHWKASMPDAKMLIRQYDRARFPNGDVVEDFLSCLGLDIDQDSRETDLNAAFGASTVRFIYMMRAAGVTQKQILRIQHTGIIPNTQDRLLPSRSEAERFVASFKDGNQRLSALIGEKIEFDDDFSRYPEASDVPPLDESWMRSVLLDLLVEATNQLP